ncbi:MAG: arginine--tRNA ligase [Omnitrophica WOR_2 bacterium RIFCSPHIGHO2_02_FULL_45_21]|nr:MAG: arginine--tRNA ligase [Omnitrophica WOR_2 bacterium RIFCSPHIGHO2_02_FULL_45_21]
MLFAQLEGYLNQLLQKALAEGLNLPESIVSGIKPPFLEIPKEESFGDISTSLALKLAQALKTSPKETAEKLLAYLDQEIPNSCLKDFIEKTDIAGAGFVNFHFSKEYFYSLLKQALINAKDYFASKSKKTKKVLLEFVSANPTGPLSVAHGRQAAVGDALCNVLVLSGYEVTREYYLNDAGNQINILGNSIHLRLEELSGERIEFPDDHYQGDYIIALARELLEAQQTTASVEYCKEYGVRRILEIIRKELNDFGVKFDSWYSQKSLEKSGKIEKAIALLKEKGFIYEQEGALWFSSTKFQDDKDRVIVKSDGSYTYLAPDIAYHQDKFKRGFDWLINLWGPDHHGYILRLKAALLALGKEKEALNVIIVQLATLLRAGKVISMSTRKGEYITLRQVLDEVGLDAARFFFLMRRTDSHLDFDLELAKQQTQENPVYYVQYAHARIASILKNSKVPPSQIQEADLSLLKEKEEINLLKAISKFENCLRVAEIQLDPYCLTTYLQELAERFHRFYDSLRVLVEDGGVRDARLALILGCKNIIALGLKLSGVSAPEKM